MKVLLSIKPEFAEKIFEGTKRYEFRKAMFKDKAVRTVVVYATRPVGQLIGEFDIENVLCEQPETLWEMTSDHSGITKDFFDSYFLGRTKSFALAVGDTRRYDPPIDPAALIDNFTPPQSYMYIHDKPGRPRVEQYELAV